jgi:hypothetical protein
MQRQCPNCRNYYDDEFRSTICPHRAFLANDGNNNFQAHTNSTLIDPRKSELQVWVNGGFVDVTPETGLIPTNPDFLECFKVQPSDSVESVRGKLSDVVARMEQSGVTWPRVSRVTMDGGKVYIIVEGWVKRPETEPNLIVKGARKSISIRNPRRIKFRGVP